MDFTTDNVVVANKLCPAGGIHRLFSLVVSDGRLPLSIVESSCWAIVVSRLAAFH